MLQHLSSWWPQVHTVGHSVICLVSLTSLDEYFLATASKGRVLHGSSLNSIVEQGHFCTNILQRIVVMYRLFNYLFISTSPLSLPVTEF